MVIGYWRTLSLSKCYWLIDLHDNYLTNWYSLGVKAHATDLFEIATLSVNYFLLDIDGKGKRQRLVYSFDCQILRV